MDAPELCIVGCGGHARSVADIALHCATRSVAFFDARAQSGETIFGFPVWPLDQLDAPPFREAAFIVAIGDNADRATTWHQLAARRSLARSVVAGDAYLGVDMVLGAGVFVGSRAHVGPLARIGDDAIVNTRAIVEHEAVVGQHSHVAVDALLLGRARIGDGVLVGARAIVLDGVSVASGVVIGAGALVTQDIHEPGTYVGAPARRTS